jgi:phosphoribosylglycinamide formyltransferase-1
LVNPSRLVVLISGNGSNLQAILDACASGELKAQVVCVISNKRDAYGLVRAKNAGVEAVYFPKRENELRPDYDARLAFQIASSTYILHCLACFPVYMPLNVRMRPTNRVR